MATLLPTVPALYVDEGLVVGHGPDHVDVADVRVRLPVLQDGDGRQVAVLEHVAHRLACEEKEGRGVE